jgi:hypothetical protein
VLAGARLLIQRLPIRPGRRRGLRIARREDEVGIRHEFNRALILRIVTPVERGTYLIDHIVV